MKFRRVLCFLLALLCVSAAAGASTLQAVIKTPYPSGSVNIREGAGYLYDVVGYAAYGEPIQILSTADKWIKVRVNSTGLVGYVNNENVSDPIDITNVAKWGSVAYGVAKRGGSDGRLLVDQGARLAATGVLEETDKANAIGHVGSWYEVQLIPTERTGNAYKVYMAEGIPAKTNAMVNIRRNDNPRAGILASPDKGADIAILSKGEKWSKVRYKGTTGYMYNHFIDFYPAGENE